MAVRERVGVGSVQAGATYCCKLHGKGCKRPALALSPISGGHSFIGPGCDGQAVLPTTTYARTMDARRETFLLSSSG